MQSSVAKNNLFALIRSPASTVEEIAALVGKSFESDGNSERQAIS